MKRVGHLHEKICQIDNIELADDRARKHKTYRWGIYKHDKRREAENAKLLAKLEDLTYTTSKYSTFEIFEPKKRLIFRLPYYPDRITHHAIMNVTEPIWVNIFIKHTYSCIKERGIHEVVKDVRKALDSNPEGTKYCLKMDVRKFYPSLDHDVLSSIIRKKIKDPKTLALLDEIIHSAEGVPIGNYLSQFFANLYLAYFDHWVKEELKCKYYFRYADDMVILSDDKNFLRNVLVTIKLYMREVLKLSLKQNYQIFPVDSRGIDFVGYRFYHSHTLLRKSIKIRMYRLINKYKSGKISKEEIKRRLQSYFGWMKYCDSKHLLNHIYVETGIHFSNWNGIKSNISKFYNKYIHVVDIVDYSRRFRVNFVYDGKSYYFESRDKRLRYSLSRYRLPVNFKIRPYVRTKKNRNECQTSNV